MRILFTGGGTGGHFYPLIAVAEEIRNLSKEQKIFDPALYFFATTPYNPELLYEYGIQYQQIDTGKVRRNLSANNFIKNFLDFFKIFIGTCIAIWKVFVLYPDVVFGKGGYSSFPTLFASIILGVPVIIHESDSIPGRVNAFIGRFSKYIAISYPEAGKYFREERVAWTGNPIRKEIMDIKREGAKAVYDLEDNVPVILILGGSQGAQKINESMVDALPQLVQMAQIIHQTGESNFEEISSRGRVALRDSQFKNRYKAFGYLNEEQMQYACGAADLVISRAGSTIFEIAVWQKPSILIPIQEAVSHNQRHNAFSYAKMGAAIVIEENNLQPEILTAEINKILSNPSLQESMRQAASKFAKKDAAHTIAETILNIGLSHER